MSRWKRTTPFGLESLRANITLRHKLDEHPTGGRDSSVRYCSSCYNSQQGRIFVGAIVNLEKKRPQIKNSVKSKISYRELLVLIIIDYFTGKIITWTTCIYCKSICKHYFLLEPASYHNKILFAEYKMPRLNQIETKEFNKVYCSCTWM